MADTTKSFDDIAFASDGWAQVELFRHQYGELPRPDDKRKIDYKVASEKMADRVAQGKVSTFNAAAAIAYLGRHYKNDDEA